MSGEEAAVVPEVEQLPRRQSWDEVRRLGPRGVAVDDRLEPSRVGQGGPVLQAG